MKTLTKKQLKKLATPTGRRYNSVADLMKGEKASKKVQKLVKPLGQDK